MASKTSSPVSGPVLEVDLSALTSNWRQLARTFTGPRCGAVVKADAYGLGAIAVSQELEQAGCREFFVASLSEALALKPHLQKNSLLYVFHGCPAGEEKTFLAHELIPVLNEPGQIERWRKHGESAPAVLHVDTGMNRLGISLQDTQTLDTHSLNLVLLMSHLACGDEPDRKENAALLSRMQKAAALFPELPTSLCNSAGICMGKEFHFTLARPGCALYGINPFSAAPNPVQHVATLSAPILQVRTLTADEAVSYSATQVMKKGSRLATVELGYADGYPRLLSGKGAGYMGNRRLPLVGRVTMDMVMLDVTDAPEAASGQNVEFINEKHDVNELAYACDTIGYEVFTRIKARVKRVYKNSMLPLRSNSSITSRK